jgi:hypothetical protein
MLQFADIRGLLWTASNDEAAEELFVAIERYLTYRSDTMDRAISVLQLDEECIGAWTLKGFLHLSARSLSLIPEARIALQKAEALETMANPRERLLTHALRTLVKGDLRGAQRILDDIVTDYPHDLLALRLQHVNAIFFGRPDVLRSTVTRALADWDDDIPGAGIVYGMVCMGLEEVGEFERAEGYGRRGADLEPDDLWSVHSVAHVMEAQGRLEDGVKWMQRPDGYWDDRGVMRHHLWWHEALFLYEAGDYDRVFAYYDEHLAPKAATGYLEMSNCASLLFRLEIAGQACGDRWEQLLEHSIHLAEDRALIFSDVHMVLALAMSQKRPELKRFARDIAEYGNLAGTFDQEASAKLTLPLIRAAEARISGDMSKATDILLDTRYEFKNMGGSIAQRDMLDLFLIDSAIAAGRSRTAQRLLSEYQDARPHSVPVQERFEALHG